MVGVNKEYLGVVVAEIVRSEIGKKLLSAGNYYDFSYQQLLSGEVDIPDSKREVLLQTHVLNVLKSYNFELSVQRHTDNRLSGVVVKFKEGVTLLLELIREGRRLSKVVSLIYVREERSLRTDNPLGLPPSVFTEYARNKYAWGYYDKIYNDPDSTQEEKDMAEHKMTEYGFANQSIRNVYGIASDDFTYGELIAFLPNPLMMTCNDLVTYVLNKKIAKLYFEGSDFDISEEDFQAASATNQALRDYYMVEEDIYSYEMLRDYISNPLGMTADDFIEYVSIKSEDEGGGQELRNKYFISQEEDMTYDELSAFILENPVGEEDRLLFKTEVSLAYKKGRFSGAKSELVVVER